MRCFIRGILISGCAFVLPLASYAQDGSFSRLETLMKTKVTSVSKKPEDPFHAPASIYVITREDIKRSGATNIPEILRLAPGLQVARAGSERWAISARGFNDNISNKLLVLIDGRSVYTPAFSGVNWDTQGTFIEDIKQIEVIRGPGASLWGANAVNGVVNIITEETVNTLEKQTSVMIGNNENIASGRVGQKVNEDMHYRIYAQYEDRDATKSISGGQVRDGWDIGRGGFRFDIDQSTSNSLTVQGDIYNSNVDRKALLPILTAAFVEEVIDDGNLFGGNILGRWKHIISNNSDISLQAYFDHTQRNFDVYKEAISTFDLDFQHYYKINDRNEITWGSGYRLVTHDEPKKFYYDFDPTTRSDNLFSAFVQNKITLLPAKLFLILGSKFEYNDYSDFEIQPTVRLSWLRSDKETIWGSISRAVRTPTRAESDISQIVGAIPNTGFISLVGSTNFDSEDLIAYELGYKLKPSNTFYFDISAFYNDYDNLRTFEIAAPSGNIAAPLVVFNNGKAESYGVEIATTWDVTSSWQLAGSYSFLTIDTHIDDTSVDTELVKDEGKSPKNQFNIRSHYTLPYNVDITKTLYYVDNLSSIDIPNYFRFDTRIAWNPIERLELSLVGQNLFDAHHKEFIPIPVLEQSEIGRSFFGKASFRF